MANTDADALIEAVREMHGATVLGIEHELEGSIAGELIVLPRGMEVKDLRPFVDARLEAPRRTKGTAQHTTIGSFIEHVNRFKLPSSAVFAVDDMAAPKLVAVVDYHDRAAPAFGEHRAEYAFPLSEEWRAWSSMFSMKAVGQADFAAFLEDRITDVLEVGAVGEKTIALAERLGLTLAGSAMVLALSKGIAIRAEVRAKQVVNLSTGEAQVLYEETHGDEGGGRVKVPGGFVIGIPVFRGGGLYQIPVRIRYRLTGGGAIAWSFSAHRADAVFRSAFDEACATVRASTELPLFVGTPER